MAEVILTASDWVEIFGRICEAIESAKDRLNDLDGAVGDGDHGVTMSIGLRAVRDALGSLKEPIRLDQVFKTAGQSFLTAAGGAIGPLIGTMWLDTAKLLAEHPMFGATEGRQMLVAMEGAVVRRGKAKPGDKTILDALHPAVLASSGVNEDDLATILEAAAESAELGAQTTINMISRLGRSSRLGNRTLGHQDAGATSMALILRTISEVVRSKKLSSR
jgi:phosphoenolpyruvate---glycerone phosphotransferase subunit DhaL